jgi:hypothetical protein
MDLLLFMQLLDGGVPGLLVKEAKEKNASTSQCNRQGYERSFVMGIQPLQLRFNSTFHA